jgi:hypothetical protein
LNSLENIEIDADFDDIWLEFTLQEIAQYEYKDLVTEYWTYCASDEYILALVKNHFHWFGISEDDEDDEIVKAIYKQIEYRKS